MFTVAAIRAQIEAKLGDRIPSAFTTRVSRTPEMFPIGIETLDAMLQGGVPRGHLTEITGASSTGRTGLSLALVARATSRGAACAWIDVQDALDPVSAAAYGVDLERLLWLRVGRMEPGTQISISPAPAQVAARGSNNIVRVPHAAHPRYEIRGMDQAVEQLFQDKSGSLGDQKVVAKSASNRVLDFAGTGPRSAVPKSNPRKIEQVPTDRLPPRCGEVVLQKRTPSEFGLTSDQRPMLTSRNQNQAAKPQSRVDQGLLSTDLLLQAGGFSIIVLDLSDIHPQQLMRIPISHWYRFRLAAEQSQAALVVLTQTPCAKSCASVMLRCDRTERTGQWRNGSETALFTSVRYRAVLERKRTENIDPAHKKAAVRDTAAAWRTHAPWAG